MIRNSKKIQLGILILLFILTLWLFFSESEITNSPLDNSTINFSTEFSGNGKLSIDTFYSFESDHLQLAMTPRDHAQSGSKIVPHSFPWIYVIYGTGISLIGRDFYRLINIISWLLMISILYELISKIVKKRDITLLPLIFVVFYPPLLLYVTKSYNPIILTLFFVSLFIFLLYKVLLRYSPQALFLLIFFSLIILLMRYDWLIVLLPPCIIVFIKYYKKVFSSPKLVLSIFLICFIILFFIFQINRTLYGEPFKIGYMVSEQIRKQTADDNNFQDTKLINYEIVPSVILSQLKSNFRIIEAFLLCAGIYFLYSVKKSKQSILVIIFLVSPHLFLLFTNLSRKTHGFDKYVLNSSFLKYNIILLVIIIVIGGLGVSKIKSQSIKAFVGVIVSLLSIVTLLNATEGVVFSYLYRESRLFEYQEVVIANSAFDEIIITDKFDKIIYPNRSIMNLTYLSEPERTNHLTEYFWDSQPEASSLYESINEILKFHSIVMVEIEQYEELDELVSLLLQQDIKVDIFKDRGNVLMRILK